MMLENNARGHINYVKNEVVMMKKIQIIKNVILTGVLSHCSKVLYKEIVLF